MNSVIRFSVGLIVFILGFTFQSAQAASGASVRECASSRGTNAELTLYIYDGELTHLRVQAGAVRARPLPFQKLAVQNDPGFTVFTIPGSSSIMRIENTVFDGQRGVVEITGDSFSCL